MMSKQRMAKNPKRPVESYQHTDKARANNPQVGLVTPSSDPDKGERRRYEYDPHTIVEVIRKYSDNENRQIDLFGGQRKIPLRNKSWGKLPKNLKSEVSEELIEPYRGTLSLPFDLGENERIAVKIVDDRGSESLRFLDAPTEVK